jgi:hypothetical protein
MQGEGGKVNRSVKEKRSSLSGREPPAGEFVMSGPCYEWLYRYGWVREFQPVGGGMLCCHMRG